MLSFHARQMLIADAAKHRARAAKLRAALEAEEWMAEAIEDEVMWDDMQRMRFEDDGGIAA